MKGWAWALLAAAGWGVMFAAYVTRARSDPNGPWAHGILVIGPDLPDDLAQVGRTTKVRLRLLTAIDRTESIIRAASLLSTDNAIKLALELRPKLIMIPPEGIGIDASALGSGHLPEAGRDQIIAGESVAHHDRLPVDDRDLEVAGVLKPELFLMRNFYLIPQSETAETLFGELDPSVRSATLVQLTGEQSRDRKLLQKLQKGLPASKYTMVMPLDWLDPVTSYTYLGGLAVFLLGGSGAIIGFFRALAARARQSAAAPDHGHFDESGKIAMSAVRPRWWAAPLLELDRRPRLVWGMHLAYFGLVIAGALLVSRLPDVQTLLLSNTRDALAASSGPLALAAKAYESGNILRAAAVTFLVNFFLGSLLVLTLPSVIVPGSGVFMAALRGLVWGLLFSPTVGSLSYAMLPHSGTMLLEGEGYILATLFGLLIPIHIFQSSLGGTPLSRFGRVLWLNVLATFWVAAVLIVAALYEATEVILMNR